jgi:hypothetical protein
MDLTLSDIFERLSTGYEVAIPAPDKMVSERIRLAVLNHKTRAERYNKDLGLDVMVLQADYDSNTKVVTLRFADKKRSRASSMTFTVLPNPELDG